MDIAAAVNAFCKAHHASAKSLDLGDAFAWASAAGALNAALVYAIERLQPEEAERILNSIAHQTQRAKSEAAQ